MKIRIFYLAVVFCLPAYAGETYCPDVDVRSLGEGRWPIPENEFTRENAGTGLEKIQKIVNGTTKDDDAEVWQNALIMVRGWILKKEIEKSDISKDERMKKYAISEFCTFIKNEAYVRH
jgi:hypothetical protein